VNTPPPKGGGFALQNGGPFWSFDFIRWVLAALPRWLTGAFGDYNFMRMCARSSQG